MDLVWGLMLKMALPRKFHDHFIVSLLKRIDFKKISKRLCHQFFLAMVIYNLRQKNFKDFSRMFQGQITVFKD